MSRSPSAGWAVPLAAVLLLWGVAFSLACRLADSPLVVQSEGESVAGRLLGASRTAFGDSFFSEADDYFHLGVGHLQTKAFTNSVIQRWADSIRPMGHVHAQGEGLKEIMPWLRLSTEMDPHNVDAYLTTAYWLGEGLRRGDLAMNVLLEAQRENPRDYRVLSARAQLFFRQRDDEQAGALLDAGIGLWPSGLDPQDRQCQLDLAQMCSYRAFLHEMKGEREKALALFKRALLLSPDNKALARRVRAIEQGEDLTQRDRATWDNLFARKKTCAREDHADHDEVEGTHDEDGMEAR
jgi:tetratricopeptide (TPR) repeat protein